MCACCQAYQRYDKLTDVSAGVHELLHFLQNCGNEDAVVYDAMQQIRRLCEVALRKATIQYLTKLHDNTYSKNIAKLLIAVVKGKSTRVVQALTSQIKTFPEDDAHMVAVLPHVRCAPDCYYKVAAALFSVKVDSSTQSLDSDNETAPLKLQNQVTITIPSSEQENVEIDGLTCILLRHS